MPRQLRAAGNPERTLLPLKIAPCDVSPVPAELRVFPNGQIRGPRCASKARGCAACTRMMRTTSSFRSRTKAR